jgi:hypothetical protein
MQILEAAKAREIEQLNRAADEESRRIHAVRLSMIESAQRQAIAEMERDSRKEAALISASRAFAPSRQNARQVADERALGLAQDALMQAEDWLSRNPQAGPVDAFQLAVKNLDNPKYFSGYESADRLRASNYIRQIKSKQIADAAKEASTEAARKRAQGYDSGLLSPGIAPDFYQERQAGISAFGGARE